MYGSADYEIRQTTNGTCTCKDSRPAAVQHMGEEVLLVLQFETWKVNGQADLETIQ